MAITRRKFLSIATTVAMGGLAPTTWARNNTRFLPKAIAFDAFPVFDPRPVFARAEQLFPGKGIELSNHWRVRQFEYQWLRALSGQYVDFWQATSDALEFSAELLKLDLTADKRQRLMESYLKLKTWPEVGAALRSLKSAGLRLAFLSNATPQILNTSIMNSNLKGVFDHVLSTDQIKTYKPHPRAYQMAIDAFDLKKEEILFVAFAGWDAAGAKSFGYPTFWVNRLELPMERLGMLPDGVGKNLHDLVDFIKAA